MSRRIGRPPTKRCDDMADMIRAGKTYKEVAAIFKVSTCAVFKAAESRGLKGFRPRGRPRENEMPVDIRIKTVTLPRLKFLEGPSYDTE